MNEIFKVVKVRLMESAWLCPFHCFNNLISCFYPWTSSHCAHCIDLDLEVYALSSIASVK